MLEEEAKTKWCPFVRAQQFQGDQNPPTNRTTWSNNCIGNQCMAWRWVEVNLSVERSTHHGYCGLAGAP